MQIPWKHVNEYQNLNVPSLNIKRLTGFFLLGRSPVGGGRFGPNSWDLGWGILGQICASAAEPVGKTLHYAWCVKTIGNSRIWSIKNELKRCPSPLVLFVKKMIPGTLPGNGCLCWLKFSVLRGGACGATLSLALSNIQHKQLCFVDALFALSSSVSEILPSKLQKMQSNLNYLHNCASSSEQLCKGRTQKKKDRQISWGAGSGTTRRQQR